MKNPETPEQATVLGLIAEFIRYYEKDSSDYDVTQLPVMINGLSRESLVASLIENGLVVVGGGLVHWDTSDGEFLHLTEAAWTWFKFDRGLCAECGDTLPCEGCE